MFFCIRIHLCSSGVFQDFVAGNIVLYFRNIFVISRQPLFIKVSSWKILCRKPQTGTFYHNLGRRLSASRDFQDTITYRYFYRYFLILLRKLLLAYIFLQIFSDIFQTISNRHFYKYFLTLFRAPLLTDNFKDIS